MPWTFKDLGQWDDAIEGDCVAPTFYRPLSERVPDQEVFSDLVARYIAPVAEALPELAEYRQLRSQIGELEQKLQLVDMNLQGLDVDRRRAALTLPAEQLPERLGEIADAQKRESDWGASLKASLRDLGPLLRDARNMAARALETVHPAAITAVTDEVASRSETARAELREQLSGCLDELVAIEQVRRVFASREMAAAARQHLDMAAPAATEPAMASI
jgi:hypothetical protein